MNAKRQFFWLIASVLLLLLVLVFTRDWLQAHMARHMLLQMPALALAGWLIHRASGDQLQNLLSRWNHEGLAGFILVQCVAGFWMVPRALDLALNSPGMELAKYISWIIAGVLLKQSMLQSHVMVQLFMLGNISMMTAAVSDVFANFPGRLCNAYGLTEQAETAKGMLLLLAVVTMAWGINVWKTRLVSRKIENAERIPKPYHLQVSVGVNQVSQMSSPSPHQK
jgi:hypothetical protein